MADIFQPNVTLDRAIFNACDALCVLAGTQRPVFGVEPIWQIQKRGCAAVQLLQSGGGFGGVTSVGLTLPSIFTVAGSPITGAGTLAATLAAQSPNTVFAGPASGGAGVPTFRSLVASDVPGGGGTVTTLSVASANGFAGTVANPTTAPAITISTTVTGIIKGNGTAISAAVADTDYQVPLTFGTGLTRTVNAITVNASQTQVTAIGTIVTGTWNATAIGAIYGGTGQTTYATGDILYASAANTLSKLVAGTNGYVLTLAAGVPTWAVGGGAGTVTNSGTLTTDQVIVGNGTTVVKVLVAGTNTHVLTMVAGVPTWQAPAAGTGTVNSALINEIAYYAAAGAAVSGSAKFTWDNTNQELAVITTVSSASINIASPTGANSQIRLRNNGATFAFLVIGAAAAYVAGSAANDLVVRAENKDIWFTVDAGATAILRMASTGMYGASGVVTFNSATASEVRVNSATGSAADIRYSINSVAKGYTGVAGSAGSLITGSATGDICIRAETASIIFSANGGTNIGMFLNSSNQLSGPSGLLTILTAATIAGVSANLRLNATSGASGSQLIYQNNGTAVAYIATPTAANNIITGSATDDLCIRSETKNINFSSDTGASIALKIVASTGQVLAEKTTNATTTTDGALVSKGGFSVANDVVTGGSIKTGAPAAGTAGAWKFGIRVAAAVAFDATQYIQLDVGGTLFKVAVAV